MAKSGSSWYFTFFEYHKPYQFKSKEDAIQALEDYTQDVLVIDGVRWK